MKKFLVLPFFLIGLLFIVKGQEFKIYYENKPQGYILYADNPEFYPISIDLDLNITNLSFSKGSAKIFVVPGKSEKFMIGELTAEKPNTGYKFSYKFKSTMGDVTKTSFDNEQAYDLPFKKGASFRVFQGYNGNFSHKGENAIDFTMPVGTEILAAREGTVVKVVQNNTESCPKEECEKYNNYIMIMHRDGTFSSYAHIKYNGSAVKPGDEVKKSDLIGYSGNVGYTNGPHLHFVCFSATFGKRNTIETKFRVGKGEQVEILKESVQYLREY